MLWMGQMNNIRARAEEIVGEEIIYNFTKCIYKIIANWNKEVAPLGYMKRVGLFFRINWIIFVWIARELIFIYMRIS